MLLQWQYHINSPLQVKHYNRCNPAKGKNIFVSIIIAEASEATNCAEWDLRLRMHVCIYICE